MRPRHDLALPDLGDHALSVHQPRAFFRVPGVLPDWFLERSNNGPFDHWCRLPHTSRGLTRHSIRDEEFRFSSCRLKNLVPGLYADNASPEVLHPASGPFLLKRCPKKGSYPPFILFQICKVPQRDWACFPTTETQRPIDLVFSTYPDLNYLLLLDPYSVFAVSKILPSRAPFSLFRDSTKTTTTQSKE